jgi:hypothetical protein
MYSLDLLMMGGKTVRNMLSVTLNKINLITLVHLVGFTIEMYYGARPCERQIHLLVGMVVN